MRNRIWPWLPILLLAACQVGDVAEPGQTPSLAISDGAHSAGNVDFFFLPPIVIPTTSLANWTRGGFNGSLSPSVQICRLVGTTVAQVATPAGSQCVPSPAPVVLSGTQVKKHFPPVGDPGDDLSGLPDDWSHYHATFPVPSNCTTSFFYRVRVRVGAVELGYADVQCITSLVQLLTLDYKKFGPALKGTTLQIPFRIERYALCPVAGVGPCGTATIALSVGGHVEFPGPDGHTVGAVTIPAQTPTAPAVTVTVQPCAGSASLPIDLPKFGGCVSVTTDPAGLELTNAATVEICNLGGDLDLSGLTPAQKGRVTLHRQSGAILQALPHVPGCTADAAVHYSVGGLVRALAQRDWHHARLQLFGLVTPQPLSALDVGAGGLTFEFSSFQFALPAKMQILSGDGQTAAPGTLLPANPTVLVTDLLGDPVQNATVNFAPSAGGSVGAASAVTGLNGRASVTWTLAAAIGPNALVASGRGIADPANNGPRSSFDPFMAIQGAFNPTAEVIPNPLQPVNLLTGSVTFGATGTPPGVPLPVNYGASGWSYQIDGTVPPDWFSSAITPFSSIGVAGFGEDHNSCALILSGVHTSWPSGTTTLYARKTISLPAAASVEIAVAVDNDVEILVDGVSVGPGLLVHNECPTNGSFVRTVSLGAGSHVIAFRAVDRGGSSYFDAQITVAAPPVL